MIETVVNMKDANGTLTGYLLNGVKTVPLDPTNRDYRAVLKWVEDGGEIDE